eukprot:CAMPEP_0170062968 /NCGR_PEP_ID=MMETSP0019_2-20121128/4001_1 /TAXON_ID=98059 /ORGANISM="Dinobryon sp., Strain UTEXLB2267" /LENGTH=592 /DNA_ID=CAMNT_0010269259 /DNA_START=539 /DNA_END=2317 /DNA_ORIENTATION=+
MTLSSESNGYGFIYFGLKVSRGGHLGCRSKASSIPDQWVVSDCNGHGTHAYAVTKARARTFLSEVYRLNNILSHGSTAKLDLLQIDQVFNRHFKSLYNRKCIPIGTAISFAFNDNSTDRSTTRDGNGTLEVRTPRALPKCVPNFVLGYNLVSPESPRFGPIHKGILYQFNMTRASRGSAGTSLKAKNRFMDVACYSFHSSRADLPHLLFVYAAAAGLCAKKWFDVKSCVGLTVHADNATDMLRRYSGSFRGGLAVSNCTAIGTSFTEHAKYPQTVRYDDQLRGVSTGAQVYGNFRSYKYFYPQGAKAIDQAFQFSDEVEEAAHAIAEAIPGRISDFFRRQHRVFPSQGPFELLCVSVDRGDSLLRWPNWPQSADYYRSAILKLYDWSREGGSNDSSRQSGGLGRKNYYVLVFVGDGSETISSRPISSSWNYSDSSSSTSSSPSPERGEADQWVGSDVRFQRDREWVQKELVEYFSGRREQLFVLQDADVDSDGRLRGDPAVRLKVFSSMCSDIVISTDAFGWWGAYLSQRNQQQQHPDEIEDEEEVSPSATEETVSLGRVVAPFVGKRTVLNPDDYFPRSWTQLKRDAKLLS